MKHQNLLVLLAVAFLHCCSNSTTSTQTDHDVGQTELPARHDSTIGSETVAPDSTLTTSAASSAVSVTAGGGTLTSENYRLHLFVAPAKPVSSGASENFRIILGPASGLSPKGGPQ